MQFLSTHLLQYLRSDPPVILQESKNMRMGLQSFADLPGRTENCLCTTEWEQTVVRKSLIHSLGSDSPGSIKVIDQKAFNDF